MNNVITFGKDQQLGSNQKSGIQTDGILYKEISFPGKKIPIAICIVFDLGQNSNSSFSTREMLDSAGQVLRTFTSRDSKSLLSELIQRIRFSASNHLMDNPFSFSIAIIDESDMHFESVGESTRVYLVHNGITERLSVPMITTDSQQNTMKFGNESEIGYKSKVLSAGDKVILCTDGLYSMVHDQNELSIIDRYDNPSFAAKHLNSLAMGRNVSDSVTTGIINFGKKGNRISKTSILLSGIAFIVLIALILVFALRKPEIPLPEDIGVAIPVSGQLFQFNIQDGIKSEIEPLTIINPGTYLISSNLEPVHLKLKTRNISSNSTQNITGVNIFLTKSSEIILSTLDYARTVNNEPVSSEILNQSTFELIKGSLLIVNEGNGRIHNAVLVDEENENRYMFTLSPTDNKGTIGVTRVDNKVELFCISGICQISNEGVSLDIPILSKAIIELSEKIPETLDLAKINDSEWEFWFTLSGETLN